MSMVQAKGRDHSKQVLHQKGWSDPPGIIESFRFQDEDDCENHFFFFFFKKILSQISVFAVILVLESRSCTWNFFVGN